MISKTQHFFHKKETTYSDNPDQNDSFVSHCNPPKLTFSKLTG